MPLAVNCKAVQLSTKQRLQREKQKKKIQRMVWLDAEAEQALTLLYRTPAIREDHRRLPNQRKKALTKPSFLTSIIHM